MFRYTGNRLPIYCNRLHLLKNNWNVANSVKSFWNQTLSLVIDYRKLVIDYQRVKTLVTWKILRKTLLKNKTVLCLFLKDLFNTSLVKSSWFLLMNLEFIFSWILKSNFSWILNLLDFFSWNLKLILILNLLTQSWNHSLEFFVIIFVIIKTIWINLIHHHEACFYTSLLWKHSLSD